MTQAGTNCSDIARSSVQYAFVALEDVPGQIAYARADQFIAITNDATITQSPEYQDSTEKLGTRDITERFKEAMPAAEASLAMNIRVPAEVGGKPQGYDALLSLFGSSTLENPPVFTLGEALTDDTVLLLESVDSLAPLPPCGIIVAGSEQIFYDRIAEDGMSLLDCKRGYNNTTAEAIAAGTTGEYKSLAFVQADCNPSFTYHLRTDHFQQAVTGATINEATLSLSNSGAVNFEFSTVQGMEVVLAGTAKVTQAAAAGDTVIHVDLAKAFTEKAWIWNSTAKDNNGGPEAGYKIASVDDEAGTITLTTPIASAWLVDHLVTGFLPQNTTPLGEPVTGDTSKVFIDGTPGKLRSSSLTCNNNIEYVTDEIGTTHPEDYVEGARTIETEMNTYFRRTDAIRFKEGYEGKFVSVRYVFGKDKVILHMPKVQQTMPTPNIEAPTVSLDITGTALGSGSGNNAIYLIFN